MPEPTASPKKLVLWIIWFALTASIVTYQMILGHGIPRGVNAPTTGISPIMVIAVAAVAAASVVRWLLIPKTRGAGKLLVLMIIGLSLCETAEFFGLFLVPGDQPETKLSLWVLALLGAVQFIPVYVDRCESEGNAFHNHS